MDFGRDYLRLALEINKHIDGYIDAYLGPADLKAEVEAAPAQPLDTLLGEVSRLQTQIPTDDPQRQNFLTASLRAMDASIRLHRGDELDYFDEIYRLYDIQPQKVDETTFDAAHRELDTLLPGAGSLAERSEAYRKQFELPVDQLLKLIELARDETQRRTQAIINLIPGETVELSLVTDQPWSAYNWYRGHAHSLIEFNVDIPVLATALIGLFAHEGYPGHHTEGQLKEKLLYHDKGYAEQAALLLHSPSAVISEGIATVALEVIFPDDTHHDWNADVLLPAAGISGHTANEMRRIEAAKDALRYVNGNAAILYHTGEYTREQTIDYLLTYGLANPARAERSFRFISNPLFRAYTFTYTEGYDLIQRAAAKSDLQSVFLPLLTNQTLPSQLL